MKKRILMIDDDKELCVLMKRCVTQEDLESDIVYTGKAGLSKITEQKGPAKQISLIFLIACINVMSHAHAGEATLG